MYTQAARRLPWQHSSPTAVSLPSSAFLTAAEVAKRWKTSFYKRPQNGVLLHTGIVKGFSHLSPPRVTCQKEKPKAEKHLFLPPKVPEEWLTLYEERPASTLHFVLQLRGGGPKGATVPPAKRKGGAGKDESQSLVRDMVAQGRASTCTLDSVLLLRLCLAFVLARRGDAVSIFVAVALISQWHSGCDAGCLLWTMGTLVKVCWPILTPAKMLVLLALSWKLRLFAPKDKGGAGKDTAQEMVRDMWAQGLVEQEVRDTLREMQYLPARISQLVKATRPSSTSSSSQLIKTLRDGASKDKTKKRPASAASKFFEEEAEASDESDEESAYDSGDADEHGNLRGFINDDSESESIAPPESDEDPDSDGDIAEASGEELESSACDASDLDMPAGVSSSDEEPEENKPTPSVLSPGRPAWVSELLAGIEGEESEEETNDECLSDASSEILSEVDPEDEDRPAAKMDTSGENSEEDEELGIFHECDQADGVVEADQGDIQDEAAMWQELFGS